MTTGAPASLYGTFSESAERGQQEAQRIQALIDTSGSLYNYLKGPGPNTQKQGKAKGEEM